MPALPLSFPDGGYEALGDAGRALRTGGARPVSEAKLKILFELERTGYPMTSREIRKALKEAWSLAVIEYHLSTLVAVRLVRPLYGPEIYFEAVSQGAVPLALAESKCTEP